MQGFKSKPEHTGTVWEDKPHMKRRTLIQSVAGAALALGLTGTASFAQDVTLRLHQFLPPPATVPKHILKP